MNRKTLELLSRLNLSGVAITAAINADGRLARVSVDTDFDKLLAARDRSFPRVHTVIVADSQPIDRLGLIKDRHPKVLRDPHAQFHVIKAETLEDAVELLELDSRTRWGQIIDFAAELHRHRDFIGRDWLIARVHKFFQNHECGYLLLTGEPGLGKSAFMAELIRRQGPVAVYHFIKQGMGNWDNPEAMVLSLSTQLRRCFAILETEEDQKQGATDAFPSLLQRVSDSLAQGQRAVLFIDGLDEAFGPTGRSAGVSLLSALARLLPRGVFVVLTSRPGEHLGWLADSTICTSVSLNPSSSDNQTDIRSYLQWRNRTGGLGLEARVLDQLADASEGNFQVAVLYLRDRPDLVEELQRWRDDPRRIPRGLTGWLTAEWQRLKEASEQSGIREPVLRTLLGLMAVAREPLSRNHLDDFLLLAEGMRIGSVSTSQLQEHLDTILSLAAGLFDPLDPDQRTRAPYHFFHTSLLQFIRDKLSSLETRDANNLLETGCLGWREADDAVRLYALRHLPGQLCELRRLDDLAGVLTDLEFLKAKAESGMVESLSEDFRTAIFQAPLEPKYGHVRVLGLAIQQADSFLERHPSALFQVLWSCCWWDISETALDAALDEMGRISPPNRQKDMGDLYKLVDGWCRRKQFVSPGFVWLKPARPPRIPPDANDQYHATVPAKGVAVDRVGRSDKGNGLSLLDGIKLYLPGHNDWLDHLVLSSNGRYLVATSEYAVASILDIDEGLLLSFLEDAYEGDNGFSSPSVPAISADGSFVARASIDGGVIVWDARSGRVLHALHDDIVFAHLSNGMGEDVPFAKRLAFGSDSNQLFCEYYGGYIELRKLFLRRWDLATGTVATVDCDWEALMSAMYPQTDSQYEMLHSLFSWFGPPLSQTQASPSDGWKRAQHES